MTRAQKYKLEVDRIIKAGVMDAARQIQESKRALTALGWKPGKRIESMQHPQYDQQSRESQISVEIGYGCGTVRTRVLVGREVTGYVDQQVGRYEWSAIREMIARAELDQKIAAMNGARLVAGGAGGVITS